MIVPKGIPTPGGTDDGIGLDLNNPNIVSIKGSIIVIIVNTSLIVFNCCLFWAIINLALLTNNLHFITSCSVFISLIWTFTLSTKFSIFLLPIDILLTK